MKKLTAFLGLLGFFGLVVIIGALAVPSPADAQSSSTGSRATSPATMAQGNAPEQAISGKPPVVIDIIRGVGRKYNLAVANLVPLRAGASSDPLASRIPARLMANLSMTGLFNNLDQRSFLERDARAGIDDGSSPEYPAWVRIGADFLVKGAWSVSGPRLTLEMRLFDVGLGRQMVGKRYSGNVKDVNRVVSQFTNEVLELITGKPGVFGSEIIFVEALDESRKSIMLTALGEDKATLIAGYQGGPSTQPTMGFGNRKAWVHRNNKKWELLVDRKVISSGTSHLSPAFKPDGTVVAAVSGPQSTAIFEFVRKSRKLLVDEGGINVSPTFSPDGTQMAYVSDKGGVVSIYVMPLRGGAGARLTKGKATDPAWSPTGEFIVFVSRETDICIVRPDGSGYKQLTGGQGRNYRPSFSPDGRMIVFHSDRNGRRQLFIMAANGDMQQPLMPNYTKPQEQPYWSPSMPAKVK